MEKKKKEPLTIDALNNELKKKGISIRRNIITHEIEIKGAEKFYRDHELLSEALPIILADELSEYFTGCTKDRIIDMIFVISGNNSYNPVKDMLDSTSDWDGHDYISDFCEAILFDPTNELERTLIKKALIQAIALAVYNNDPEKPFGAEGVLTLYGAQGAGKTRLLSYLALKDTRFYREGLCVNTRDKDTIIRATSCWIAELGEVETTLRIDIEALKAFLTQATDRYRAPYARKDTTHIRHTSFIASCNSEQYLIDTTGNRRFFTVHVKDRIDFEEVEKTDFAQLWKQVDKIIEEEGVQSYRPQLSHTEKVNESLSSKGFC